MQTLPRRSFRTFDEARNYVAACRYADRKPKGGLFRDIHPMELEPAVLILKGLNSRLNVLEAQRAAATAAAKPAPAKAPKSEEPPPLQEKRETLHDHWSMQLEPTVGSGAVKTTKSPLGGRPAVTDAFAAFKRACDEARAFRRREQALTQNMRKQMASVPSRWR